MNARIWVHVVPKEEDGTIATVNVQLEDMVEIKNFKLKELLNGLIILQKPSSSIFIPKSELSRIKAIALKNYKEIMKKRVRR